MQMVLSEPVLDLAGVTRHIEIWVGDLTDLRSGGADLLVVSAFPDDYWPRPGTVVHALGKLGIDVQAEALRKAHDWRASWHCWVSQPLVDCHEIGRLLCFEHGSQQPAEKVGDVMRAASELVLGMGEGGELDVFRMPLLATGDQRASKRSMLEAILRQAFLHLLAGLPVRRLQLVLWDQDPDNLRLLVHAGRVVELAKLEWVSTFGSTKQQYDFFISYRRKDLGFAQSLMAAIQRQKAGASFFLDQERIAPGAFWKPDLLRAVASSQRVLCVITDSYSESVECMDEFHAALCYGVSRAGFLKPLMRLDQMSLEQLPATIRRVNCIDARTPPLGIDSIAEAVLV